MKNISRLLMGAAALSLLFVAGCSKDNTGNTADPSAKQHNEDASNIKGESDNVNTDVNNSMLNITAFGKQAGVTSLDICGATIDSSHQNDPTPYIIITFNPNVQCTNPARTRSGQIKVELISGSKWTDAGAMLRITHTDYKVTFTGLNNHSLTFNGNKYLTDVDGVTLLSLFSGVTIKERSDMHVTFENDSVAHWETKRSSTWGIKSGGEIFAVVNGDTTINNQTIDSWGTNRFGTTFITSVTTPWRSSSLCGWWRPTQGQYTSTTPNFSVSATLGVDHLGAAVTTGCAYGFKLNWVVNSNNSSGQVILPYW